MSCTDCDKDVLGWRVWTDDGRVFDSVHHAFADVPDDGLLFRKLYYRNGSRQNQQGVDFYFEAPHQSGETIYGSGKAQDQIAERYPGAVIKRGRWAPDAFYRRVCDAAAAATEPPE